MTRERAPLAPSLRLFLDDRGLRYEWIAERLDISKGHLTRIMNGERGLTPDSAWILGFMYGVPESTFYETPAFPHPAWVARERRKALAKEVVE